MGWRGVEAVHLLLGGWGLQGRGRGNQTTGGLGSTREREGESNHWGAGVYKGEGGGIKPLGGWGLRGRGRGNQTTGGLGSTREREGESNHLPYTHVISDP